MRPHKTVLKTREGLVVYVLNSITEIVAGPDGYDAEKIDPDNLPAGFVFISDVEWNDLTEELNERNAHLIGKIGPTCE